MKLDSISRGQVVSASASRPEASGGFTLLELVVVVAVLALGTSVLVPALTRTQGRSAGLGCQNNMRQLALAWQMYAEDCQGLLAPNRDGTTVGASSSSPTWVRGWLDFTSSPANTNTAYLVDYVNNPYGAKFGPYVRSAKVFRCPADKSAVTIAGQLLPRVRSVSMNSWVGEGTHSWVPGSRYQLYRKISDIVKPAPASLYVLLDEHEASINDGTFFTNPDTAYNIIDYPAGYHGRAGGFAFADGHTEIHRWSNPATTPILNSGQILYNNVTLPGDADVTWLQQHSTSLP